MKTRDVVSTGQVQYIQLGEKFWLTWLGILAIDRHKVRGELGSSSKI